ncbi:T9SS type A sorting domain-containing protein [Salinivirga cyanobacteriivorans]
MSFIFRSKIILGILLFFLIVFGVLIHYVYTDNEIAKKELEEEKKLFPNEWFYRQRAFPSGKIDRNAYRDAIMSVTRRKKYSDTSKWRFCGPDNIGGRITDIEVTGTTIYVGAASGGIFKTTDFSNWEPIFDNVGMLSIGDLCIAPSDTTTIYAGTGEANGGASSQAGGSVGVFKSTNSGKDWECIGLENAGSIGKILVSPKNPDVCYVAAMGPIFENGGDRGIYKTVDGGDTWEHSLWVNDSTGFIDLAMHPTQPDTLYAAAWQRDQGLNYINFGGAASGIYRSYDGGQTWDKLEAGLPDTAGRIGIAVAPSSPNFLYAYVVDEETHFIKGIYRSSDYGDSWIAKSTAGIYDAPYNWFFGRIYVDPIDHNTVYIGALAMHKTTDGGSSWFNVFDGTHVDQHALAFDPTNSEKVYIGNDGGFYYSLNGGVDYQKADGLPITQFYTCEIDYVIPERIYGGTQDNSSMRTMTGGISDWEIISQGDGFYNLIDPTDNNYIYTEYQYGNLMRSTDGGENWDMAINGIEPGDRKNWNTPVVFNPSNPEELFYGAHRVYKSTDRAQNWTPISPDLTDGPGEGNMVFNTITSISVSPLNENIVLAGTDDGNISISENGGDSWNNISASLPRRWVTSVATSISDPEVIYATFSGYSFYDNAGHVYRSDDRGSTWINISNALPDVPINKIINIAENVLVVATDVGVYISRNNGDSWSILGEGLPVMFFTDLDYHQPTNKLVTATFGRGIYSIAPDTAPASSLGDELSNSRFEVYPNPTRGVINIDVSSMQAGDYLLEIYNAAGLLVKPGEKVYFADSRQFINMDAADLSAGYYLIILKHENKGFILSNSIIKY